jgi:hypothetical protein
MRVLSRSAANATSDGSRRNASEHATEPRTVAHAYDARSTTTATYADGIRSTANATRYADAPTAFTTATRRTRPLSIATTSDTETSKSIESAFATGNDEWSARSTDDESSGFFATYASEYAAWYAPAYATYAAAATNGRDTINAFSIPSATWVATAVASSDPIAITTAPGWQSADVTSSAASAARSAESDACWITSHGCTNARRFPYARTATAHA